MGFVDVHYTTPSVLRLPFHLPGQQQIVFGAEDDIENVINKTSVASSMFLAWMKCNEFYKEARKLTNVEFSREFVWKLEERRWGQRKKSFLIGKIHSVSLALGEAYYLKILLNKVKGPKSFEDIRTINGDIFPTFRDACYAIGLLDYDKEYVDVIEEASLTGSGFYLRSLFATMLISNSLFRPKFVWQKTWQYLADGILYNYRIVLKSPDLFLNDDQVKNLTLFEIEKILLYNNSSLKKFITMSYSDDDSAESSNNRLITKELDYDKDNLQNEFRQLLGALTNEQRGVYDDIMTAVQNNKGGGRTTHHRFQIPLILNEYSLSYIKPKNDVAKLIKKTRLIIWDEAPMVHWHAFEALDKSMNGIFGCQDITDLEMLFGGKVVIFGEDL